LKRTLFFAYTAQVYISLIGILLMPLFLRLMGAEAFGLIGFFLMLQAWLQLLDLGLSPTLSREMSIYRAGRIDSSTAWQRLRSLEWLLGVLALVVVSALILWRHTIASGWLNFQYLSSNDVATCIMLMAITAALRLLMGLYRSGLIGMERQLLVNGLGVTFVTVKFVGVLPLLIYWSPTPLIFFSYQVLIALIEVSVFVCALYRQLPDAPISLFPVWSELRGMLPVAGSMAFLGGMWVSITQIDKLILSKILSLEDYGYFTLAIMLASGLIMLTLPLNQVLQPRMTILASQNKRSDLCELYKLSTQVITAGFIALGGTFALFAEQILFAWTGNTQTATIAAPILFWYGLANTLIGVLILPFMLQFAYGYLRLHVIGNLLLLVTLIPTLIWASIEYGGTGAGITLLTSRILFLFLWVPFVHRRLLPEVVWSWPLFDVGKIAITVIAFLSVARGFIPQIENRVIVVLVISLIFLGSILIGMLTGVRSRESLKKFIENHICPLQ
jgi:O-antigen/teichoic acid export membrane protein